MQHCCFCLFLAASKSECTADLSTWTATFRKQTFSLVFLQPCKEGQQDGVMGCRAGETAGGLHSNMGPSRPMNAVWCSPCGQGCLVAHGKAAMLRTWCPRVNAGKRETTLAPRSRCCCALQLRNKHNTKQHRLAVAAVCARKCKGTYWQTTFGLVWPFSPTWGSGFSGSKSKTTHAGGLERGPYDERKATHASTGSNNALASS